MTPDRPPTLEGAATAPRASRAQQRRLQELHRQVQQRMAQPEVQKAILERAAETGEDPEAVAAAVEVAVTAKLHRTGHARPPHEDGSKRGAKKQRRDDSRARRRAEREQKKKARKRNRRGR